MSASFDVKNIRVANSLLNGLMAYWKFDETSGTNINDEVGSADMTLYNTATFNSNGKLGYCYEGGADNTSMARRNNDSNLKPNNAFSISFWVRLNTLPSLVGTQCWIYAAYNVSSPYNPIKISISNTSNKIVFEVYDTNSVSRGASETDACVVDTWYHYVVTYSNNTVWIYKNNSDVTSSRYGSASGNIYDYGSYQYIGNNQNSNLALVGRIDELGIWNRALTVDEISNLYNSGAGKTYPF